jgi:hypothetical protein
LLLEPQRTNSLQFSEQFDNSYFTKGASSITANAAISPSGYQDADKVVPDTSSANHTVYRAGQAIAGGIYSVFAKADGYDWILLTSHPTASSAFRGAFFNVSNGTIGTAGAGINAKIENYGNGWYRCSINEGGSPSTIWSVITTNADNVTTFEGNGTDGVLIWGGQNEQGAYATSYIPTLSTSVTRVADAASKTGISSLIGQTEGTLFAEVDIQSWASGERILGISDGTTDNSVVLQKGTAVNTLRTISRLSNVLQVTIQSSTISGNTFKLAVAYKANDFVFYVNGVQIGTSTSASVPACSAVYLGKLESASESSQLNGRNSQALLFKTRLTNAQLAELTTL